jgi:hypothetical protein
MKDRMLPSLSIDPGVHGSRHRIPQLELPIEPIGPDTVPQGNRKRGLSELGREVFTVGFQSVHHSHSEALVHLSQGHCRSFLDMEDMED